MYRAVAALFATLTIALTIFLLYGLLLKGDIVAIALVGVATGLYALSLYLLFVKKLSFTFLPSALALATWIALVKFVMFLLTLNEAAAVAQTEFTIRDTNDTLTHGARAFNLRCSSCHTSESFAKRLSYEAVKYAIENGANYFGYKQAMPNRYLIINSATKYPITDGEIERIAEYVATGMRGKNQAYIDNCAKCHGKNGMRAAAAPLSRYSAAFVRRVLRHGKKSAFGRMPAFSHLREGEIAALAEYVASLNK